MKSAKLALLFGSTGATGFHAANALVSQGFAVRLVTRSKKKISQLYKQKQVGFEQIVQGSLDQEETLRRAFEPSERYGKVVIVVSALGTNIGDNPEKLEYHTQLRLIEKSKEMGIDKYIYVSGALIERPWNPLMALLNTIMPNIYQWKAKAENHLRRSGLNYAILRPTSLKGKFQETTATAYEIKQIGHLGGSIQRSTLGSIIAQVAKSEDIPSKVTFECAGASSKTQLTFSKLEVDTDKSIVTSNHITPKYVYGVVLLTLILYGLYALVGVFSG